MTKKEEKERLKHIKKDITSPEDIGKRLQEGGKEQESKKEEQITSNLFRVTRFKN